MTTVAAITEILEAEPGLTASAIAERFGVDRSDINQVLNANSGRYTQSDDRTWRLTPATNRDAPTRRPGPFGPARDLIPKDQQLEMLSADTPCHVALDRMTELNYSVLPVRNPAGVVIGVFTWRRFSDRVLGLYDSKVTVKTLTDQPVEDFMVPPKFLDPDQYIDTTVDWSDVDYVIVGTPKEPEGILTVSDVWAKLNDFAEAYVLLHEIETDLRDLIALVAGDRLVEWIGTLQVDQASVQPQHLHEFTFSQYYLVIGEKKVRWPCFEPVLEQPRALFVSEINRINVIRNQVMHFKEPTSVARCNQLRGFRDRIRRAIERAHMQQA